MILLSEEHGLARFRQKAVIADGCFDPLHAGHIAYLEAASSYGPVLCAVVSDAYLSTKRTPLLPQAQRAAVVDGLRAVTSVVLTDRIADLIRAVEPISYVKGRDWEGRLPADILAACDETKTRIVYTDTVMASSSDLLRQWNAVAVCRFERLVLSQPPAKPWQPVTDYSFHARKEIEGRHPELIWRHLIRRDDADVLDYGCGPDGHLVQLLNDFRRTLYPESHVTIEGYDPQARWPQLRRDEPEIEPTWDLVICREVLEHLTMRSLRETVAKLCGLSRRFVYVTTRFHPQPAHLLDVAIADDLDPTHITMMNQELLRTLFVLEGFKRRTDLEARLDWRQQGRVLIYERA